MTNKEEPQSPMALRWTYLRPYGSGDRYSTDLYKTSNDNLYFLKKGEPDPYEVEESGRLTLDVGREELDELIAELVWLRDNWGEVGREH